MEIIGVTAAWNHSPIVLGTGIVVAVTILMRLDFKFPDFFPD